MNGVILFKRTIEKTIEALPLAPKQQQLLHYVDKQNYKLTKAAKLLDFVGLTQQILISSQRETKL